MTQNKIGEVKKILWGYFEDELTETSLQDIATEICQLFEPKLDDPDRLEEFAPGAIEKIMEMVGVKPDESRLLTSEEIMAITHCLGISKNYEDIAKAQDAKTASIKDAECQQRVERIFNKIESKMAIERCDPDVMPYFTDYYWMPIDIWQALKKREGIDESRG